MGYCGLDARHINEGSFTEGELDVASACAGYFRWDLCSLAVQVTRHPEATCAGCENGFAAGDATPGPVKSLRINPCGPALKSTLVLAHFCGRSLLEHSLLLMSVQESDAAQACHHASARQSTRCLTDSSSSNARRQLPPLVPHSALHVFAPTWPRVSCHLHRALLSDAYLKESCRWLWHLWRAGVHLSCT